MLLPEVELWGRGNSRLVVYRILSLDLGRSILWRFFQVVFEFCMQIFLLTMWKKRYLWFDTIQMENTNDLLYFCISQISSLHVRCFTTLAISSRHQTQEVIYHAPAPILPASSRSHNCGQGVGKIRFEGLQTMHFWSQRFYFESSLACRTPAFLFASFFPSWLLQSSKVWIKIQIPFQKREGWKRRLRQFLRIQIRKRHWNIVSSKKSQGGPFKSLGLC